jgi:molybdate transport system substrate-binding protein
VGRFQHLRAATLALAVVALAAAGCGSPAVQTAAPIRVAAASDLSAALGELILRFAATSGVNVTVSYGSSGAFYTQLQNQAPFDVFFSADVEYPKQLEARRLTLPDSAFTYAIGRLVIWTPPSSPLDVGRDGLQALTAASVAHIAIANPEHAPYGKAAVAALKAAGLYDRLQPKLVYGESVSQAMQFVQSGAADAGIVAQSLAMAPNVKDKGRWTEVPQALYPRLEQGGVILKNTPNAEAARRFRAFVLSAEGRAILAQFGFTQPPG